MTAQKDPIAQAVDNARALLATLLASEWREMHVISGETEIFLAREGAGPNPMHAMTSSVPAPLTLGPETLIAAPHIATLVDALSVGTLVSVGQTVATLRVLDEEVALTSPLSGNIVRIDAALGELLDYDTTILAIVEAA